MEKALVDFGGRPLLCRTLEKLELVVDEVIVVARSRGHAQRLKELASGAAYTWDSVIGFGPVAGLEAGMRQARGEMAFATGCDLPFLNPRVVEELFLLAEGHEGCDAIVPERPNGYVEPLHSVYNCEKMMTACQTAMEKNERRIRAPLQQLCIRPVPVERFATVDADLLTFFNLNTPEDLEKARRLWQEG